MRTPVRVMNVHFVRSIAQCAGLFWSEKMAYWAVVQYSWHPESSNLQGRKADLGISNILVETIFCRRICQI